MALRVCAVAFLLIGAAAEQPKEAAKATLAIAVAPGKPVLFVRTVDQGRATVLKDLGRRIGSRNAKSVTEFSLEVLEALPDGEFKARLCFGLQTATGLGMDGKPETLRSDQKLSEENRLSGCQDVALGGTAFPVKIHASGVVHGVEECAEARKVRARVLGFGKDEEAVLMVHIRPETVAAQCNVAFLATPFPEKNVVAVGTSWQDEEAVDGIKFQDIVLRQTLRVARVENGEVRVESTGDGTVIARPKELLRGKNLGRLAKKVTVTDPKVATMVTLSLADGLPLSAATEASMEYLEEGTKYAEMWSWKCTLERVAAWPSKKK